MHQSTSRARYCVTANRTHSRRCYLSRNTFQDKVDRQTAASGGGPRPFFADDHMATIANFTRELDPNTYALINYLVSGLIIGIFIGAAVT